MNSADPGRPRIVFLHFTAPPIVGGVEAVIAEHARLFHSAGYQTLILAGRAAEDPEEDPGPVLIIPELDSENPRYLEIHASLEQGKVPLAFREMQVSIERQMDAALQPGDIVIAHNVLTTHFNLALTAAVHEAANAGRMPRLIVWCHDISRHVNPQRQEVQYHGGPWDLLRTRIRGAVYVAVSSSRQESLAGILDCPASAIRVIPNGVDPVVLLGLSDLGRHFADTFGLFDADLVILMPVRITRVKNIEFALQVLAALKRADIDTRLVVTGPPDPHAPEIHDYVDDLRDLRTKLSLDDDAIFIHDGTDRYPSPLLIEWSVVAELYRIADIILMPSLREGFGMPVLEAGLVDRPVFATSIPATQDLPDFQYLIRTDESAESVAERIRQWASSDPAHALRVQVRQEFTWQRLFRRKILPLITEMGGSPNPAQR